MKTPAPEPRPPRLSMDAYVTFLEEAFRTQTPDNIRRQKALEERIDVPFDMRVPPSSGD